MGPRRRESDRLPRRHRSRRGGRRRRRSRSPPRAGRATGTPPNPGALADGDGPQPRDRRDPPRAHARREDAPARPPEPVEDVDAGDPRFPDERLELIFTCCHPALAREAQVALTLRALGGLRTEEIARAFLVPEETMKRRLSRAKQKIRDAGIPFRVPADHLLPARLGAVLAVVYLIFNEGYGGRGELASEALRLGRGARRADARRARGARPARADAAPRRAPRGPLRRRRARAARGPGSRALGRRRDRARARRARPRARAAAGAGRYVAAGGDRLAPPRAAESTGRRSPRSTASSCG